MEQQQKNEDFFEHEMCDLINLIFAEDFPFYNTLELMKSATNCEWDCRVTQMSGRGSVHQSGW